MIKFTPKQDFHTTIYIYYQLENFYQNHRRFARSRNTNQLAGQAISLGQAQRDCDPISQNKHLIKGKSWDGVPLDPEAVANPCGLLAKYMFNDTFKLYEDEQLTRQIEIIEHGIAWVEDKGIKFKRAPNSRAVQWLDPEDEHFIVWMRVAGLPKFRKLWGKLESHDLKAGENYYLEIQNNYNV